MQNVTETFGLLIQDYQLVTDTLQSINYT
jgi:hypothetical protein